MAIIKRQTTETLRSDVWRACDILRRDNNVGGVVQYTERSSARPLTPASCLLR